LLIEELIGEVFLFLAEVKLTDLGEFLEGTAFDAVRQLTFF